MWGLKICANVPGHMTMPIYGEKLSSEPRGRWPWNLVYSIGYSVEYYQNFHMMTLSWPWPFLWQGQICFWMLLHGWKLIQHCVLRFFQVCYNSAYPQHSGERYRTNGPLVTLMLLLETTWVYMVKKFKNSWLFTSTISWRIVSFLVIIGQVDSTIGKVKILTQRMTLKENTTIF